MNKIKDENYFQVSGWMLNRLQLKGNELIIYAIIYGFTQNGESQWYTGTRQYLADFAGCSRNTVDNCLASLTQKGHIQKQEYVANGVKFCNYRANCDTTPKIVTPPTKNCDTPPAPKIVTSDNDRDINNNINNIPTAGEAAANAADKNIIDVLKRRVNALFKRRDTTNWTEKETAKLRQVAKRNGVLDECAEIEKLYNSGYEYRRRDIVTFLNNWTTELDRARNNAPESKTTFQRPQQNRYYKFDGNVQPPVSDEERALHNGF